MNFDKFTEHEDAYQIEQVDKYGREFKQFSNVLLVRLFFDLLDQFSCSTLIELGAHRATASRNFMRAKKGRRAIAVEANPYNYERFKEKVEKGGTVYKNLAMTNETGFVNMILSDNDSDRKRGHRRTCNSLLRNKDFIRTKTIQVSGITFDDLIKESVAKSEIYPLNVNRPSLWVDLEGALGLLLEGAQKMLPECFAVFAEIEATPLFDNQIIGDEIFKAFSELNFIPFLRDCEYNPKQYNVIFINRRFANSEKFEPIRATYVSAINNFKPV